MLGFFEVFDSNGRLALLKSSLETLQNVSLWAVVN
jgi:hypothetical protein